jgi:pilus assembly protein CpaB
MNRGTRHVLVVGLAVITAGVASFGVYRAVGRIPVREVEVAHSFLVVASRSLPPGVRLSANDVRLAAWPESSLVPGGFSKIEEVVEHALLASVVENEPITQSKLASIEEGAGLSPAIPLGMRAMSVKVNEVIGVAGFLDPGTRVDLVVTIRKRDETMSKTVASNVEVLSAGTRLEQEKNRATGTTSSVAPATSPAPPTVVTLLVTPQGAERIALAQAEGQIMLVLRNPLDTAEAQTMGARTAVLIGSDVSASPAPAVRKIVAPTPVAPSEPVVVARKPYLVEAIRAAKRSEEEVVQ